MFIHIREPIVFADQGNQDKTIKKQRARCKFKQVGPHNDQFRLALNM